MPFMKKVNGKSVRDYGRELEWEKKTHPNRVKDRADRNAARSTMEKAGKVTKGDGKQVDHKRELVRGGSNDKSNLRVTTAKTNLTKEANRKKAAARKK